MSVRAMSYSHITTMHCLCIAALILPACAFPALDTRSTSELLPVNITQNLVSKSISPPSEDVAPSENTSADGPFHKAKPQPQPTQLKLSWPNILAWPNNYTNRAPSHHHKRTRVDLKPRKGNFGTRGPKDGTTSWLRSSAKPSPNNSSGAESIGTASSSPSRATTPQNTNRMGHTPQHRRSRNGGYESR